MILRAVYHIHENRLIHRDVKPQNILISAESVLKLTDFGLTHAYYNEKIK